MNSIGELLYLSYANLAMAHSAISGKALSYGPRLADDDRLKMILPQACCYCGSAEQLSVDHLIPRKRGGANSGDNIVWACRSCNSAKCAEDALEWLARRGQFPPLLLLRRYLKLAVEISRERNLMDTPISEAPADLPFTLAAIPLSYPPPAELTLYVDPRSCG